MEYALEKPLTSHGIRNRKAAFTLHGMGTRKASYSAWNIHCITLEKLL